MSNMILCINTKKILQWQTLLLEQFHVSSISFSKKKKEKKIIVDKEGSHLNLLYIFMT